MRRSVNCLGVAESGKAAQATTQDDLLTWVKNDKRRMLHVVYRVGDMDRTIKYFTLAFLWYGFDVESLKVTLSLKESSDCCRFYTECLGMKLLRKRDIPEEKYTNAFLGYGPEDSHFVIELTYSKLYLYPPFMLLPRLWVL